MKNLAFVLVLTLAALTVRSVAAKECRAAFSYGSNSAFLTGRYIGVAKDNAIFSWGLRVTASLGPGYADWSLARNKSFRCVKQTGRHKCTAKARPCTKN